MIYIGPFDDLQFWVSPTFSGAHVTLYSNFGALGTWTHLAFTLNRSTGEFITYMNGNIIAISTRIYEPNTMTNLRIGAGGNEVTPALFPVGNGTLMDDFRIYNRVLSSFEIADMMKPAIGSVRSITFAPSLGRWVAVGGNGAANTITYSTDATGTAWSLPSEQGKAIPTAIFRTGSEATRVIWDAVGGRFLVGGWNGAASIATLTNVAGMDGANNNPGYTMGYSGDGVNWTPVSVRTSDNDGSGSGSGSIGSIGNNRASTRRALAGSRAATNSRSRSPVQPKYGHASSMRVTVGIRASSGARHQASTGSR